MKYVFSLTILFIIVFSLLVVPVEARLRHEPTDECPDPWTNPIGFVMCYIKEWIEDFIEDVLNRISGFFSDILNKFKAAFKGFGEGVADGIRGFFNELTGKIEGLREGAEKIRGFFASMWDRLAVAVSGLGPFAPAAFTLIFLAVVMVLYLFIRIVSAAL